MPRPHRKQFAHVLLAILVIAVLALAIAQSAQLHPTLAAVVVLVLATCSVLQHPQSSTLHATFIPFRRQPHGVVPLHFPMPPPIAFAA